jgi:hypothetical protein
VISIVAYFALGYSGVNWVLFATCIIADRLMASAPKGLGDVKLQAAAPDKLLSETGKLAEAFKSAGAPATAAAMSTVGLVIAAIAAGIDKVIAH